MYSKDAGALHADPTRTSAGKLIDEWRFVSPLKRKDAPKLSAKIYIHKSDRSCFSFKAQSDSLPCAIVDTDINSLRQKVDAALRHQHDMLTGVAWDDWLEVEVRGKRSARTGTQTVESDLRITYRMLKRGVDPATGDAYTVNTNGIAVSFPSPKQAGELDPDAGRDDSDAVKRLSGYDRRLGGRDVEAEYSYLAATPENIAALEDLIGRLQVLRDSLSTFLRQGTVQQSLTGLVSQTPALPAPL